MADRMTFTAWELLAIEVALRHYHKTHNLSDPARKQFQALIERVSILECYARHGYPNDEV